jgi:predicted glutamine amidotransferase
VAHLDRAPETASTSAGFSRALANTSTDGGLLHLRWATKGLPVSENNTHPFTYKDYSFIHNGAIYPETAMDHLIDPKFFEYIAGNTDSEKYFYLLLTEIEKHGMAKGISSTVGLIKENADYSSINAMIMNEDTFVVVSEFQPAKKPDWAPDDYYEIKYRADSEGVLVASSGWNQPGWKSLDNHHSLVVDRSTFQTQVITH